MLTASDAHTALEDLCGGMLGPNLSASAEVVTSAQMPVEFQRLLAHPNHMTTTLAAYHGKPVALRILETRLEGNQYRRTIVLMPVGTSYVVELGVVRINLNFTPSEVRREILEQRAPLGDILIRHDVMRRIQPRWFLKFEERGPVFEAFGRKLPGSPYGRLGTISCDDQPAIELLEVVGSDRMNT